MDHLRGHKISSVARSHQEPVLCSQLFGKSKVTDAYWLWVARLIHIQDVTGFKVPVNHLGRMNQESIENMVLEGAFLDGNGTKSKHCLMNISYFMKSL